MVCVGRWLVVLNWDRVIVPVDKKGVTNDKIMLEACFNNSMEIILIQSN